MTIICIKFESISGFWLYSNEKLQQDGQCTYKATLSSFRITIIAVGRQVLDGQCTYKATLRSFHITITAVKRQVLNIIIVYLYACLSCLPVKSHLVCVVLYCNLWPVWFYHVFCFKLSHKRKDFRKIY